MLKNAFGGCGSRCGWGSGTATPKSMASFLCSREKERRVAPL